MLGSLFGSVWAPHPNHTLGNMNVTCHVAKYSILNTPKRHVRGYFLFLKHTLVLGYDGDDAC
jgi:hypothetical protein